MKPNNPTHSVRDALRDKPSSPSAAGSTGGVKNPTDMGNDMPRKNRAARQSHAASGVLHPSGGGDRPLNAPTSKMPRKMKGKPIRGGDLSVGDDFAGLGPMPRRNTARPNTDPFKRTS